MADQLYRVEWKAGEITVHASNEKRAVDVALEYIRVPEAKRISVEPVHAHEDLLAKAATH